jgi:hypothetical protein
VLETRQSGSRTAIIGILIGVLGASTLSAMDFSSSRGLPFGMNLAPAAKLAGTKLNEVKIVRQEPAPIQEMDWQPRPPVSTDSAKEGSRCLIDTGHFNIEKTRFEDLRP